jgi:antitoxin (DNA-binding transcriptional repressor) of toxin-antitoxin stability system
MVAVGDFMKRIGIREFRDNATTLLAGGETMLIERHGHPVGYFIPIKRKDTAKAEAAMKRLEKVLEKAIAESGLSEDELADLFTVKRGRATRR